MTKFNETWLSILARTLGAGSQVSPRGRKTVEHLQATTVNDMRYPVLTVAERKLSYQFMAAEAYWILSGDDRVSTIAPYNKNIAQFSDDGERFFGAYGPKVTDQLPYVLAKLREDRSSRQAGLTIWREKPPTTKDVPCTIAIFFSIRSDKLNCHVFMRSSDIWLGLPYDTFTFSMLAHLVCAYLNSGSETPDVLNKMLVTPGNLYLTAASSHLYEEHFAMAEAVINSPTVTEHRPTPPMTFGNPENLIEGLRQLRDTKPGDALRWWE